MPEYEDRVDLPSLSEHEMMMMLSGINSLSQHGSAEDSRRLGAWVSESNELPTFQERFAYIRERLRELKRDDPTTASFYQLVTEANRLPEPPEKPEE